MSRTTPGRLHVVATPIGNLGDLSPRALEVLRSVDRIAAEDTRHTQQLLAAFGARATLVALHEHNEAAQSAQLVAQMLSGENIALVSDAGTPLVSDPGFPSCARRARPASPVIRCRALRRVAALSVAGIASDPSPSRASFRTKPPRRPTTSMAAEPHTLIFESSTASPRYGRCGAGRSGRAACGAGAG